MVETTINKRVTTARTEALYVSKTLAIQARLYRVTELHLTQFPVYCYHLDARQNHASDQSQPATRMSLHFDCFVAAKLYKSSPRTTPLELFIFFQKRSEFIPLLYQTSPPASFGLCFLCLSIILSMLCSTSRFSERLPM